MSGRIFKRQEGSGMNPLFFSPGSKTRLAKRLIGMYPVHQTYIEPFAGGAACFWNKKPSPVEILNDYDPDIANAYRVVRDLSNHQLNSLIGADWRVSNETFARCQEPTDDEVESAYRFIYRRRASFAARENNINRTRIGSYLPVPKYLYDQHQRLRNVRIDNHDGVKVIEQNDRPGVFMFLDPPWPGYFWKWKHYEMSHIRDMLDALKDVKRAKWIYAETPSVEDEISGVPDGWHQNYMEYPSTSYGGKKSIHREVIFSNYELDRNRIPRMEVTSA